MLPDFRGERTSVYRCRDAYRSMRRTLTAVPTLCPRPADVPWNRGTRTRGAQAPPHRSPQQPGPDRAQAAVDQDPATDRAGIYGAEGPGPQPGAAHGL